MTVLFEQIHAPALALDMQPSCIRALLYRPGEEGGEPFSLTLPAALQELSADAPVYSDAFWNGILVAAGMPQAKNIVAALSFFGSGQTEDGVKARAAFFQGLFAASEGPGVDIRALCAGPARAALLRLGQIQRISHFLVADGLCASILGVLADSAVHARSFREGIAIVRLEQGRASAALVFQDRLLAVAERTLAARDALSGLLEDLDSFRLGWLPQEKMAALGGFTVAESELPAEAEGFRPLYITGQDAEWLRGRGIFPALPCGPAMTTCLGLLHGFALQEA